MQNVRLGLTNFLFSVANIAASSYCLNKAQTKCVTDFLDLYLTTQVNIAFCSGVVVLNAIEWFIVLPFKTGIPNSTLYQLAACYRTIDMYCKLFSRVTCTGVHVLLSGRGGLFTVDVISGSHTHIFSCCF